MQVGAYIDGYNLYYGARKVCGKGTAGWRWLDLRALLESSMPGSWREKGATLERVVYCTARVSGTRDPSSPTDQNTYLQALEAHGSADHIEYGNFVSRVKFAPLATEKRGTKEPVLVKPRWPIKLQDSNTGRNRKNVVFIVSHLRQEEKGSDANVATHLLVDVLEGLVQAAIVVSNDSDLKLPVQEARKRVPVGVLNPGQGHLAGDLAGSPTDGVGDHWWGLLDESRYKRHQLPDPAGGFTKPNGW